MFWKKARKKYGRITAADKDIQCFQELMPEFQTEGYQGITGWLEDIGHRWIARRLGKVGPILEIGAGTGRFSLFYSGDSESYFQSEYLLNNFRSGTFHRFNGRRSCCNARFLPFQDLTFQTVISIYNLEHIEDLQTVCREVHRVLKPGGVFLVALPCEGGLAWNLGRELTTRPAFQKKYGINYDKIIAYEHVWDFPGVFEQIRESQLFHITKCQLFPFLIPCHHLNLVACIECSVEKSI